MAHTYANLLYHIIFSTKNRAPLIDDALAERLFPYIGGAFREMNGMMIDMNGPENHVHILAKLSQNHSIADILRNIRGNSSRWVHDTFRERASIAWQTGYAAFTVSESVAGSVRQYIRNQKEHHKTVTFEEEFIAFLRKNRIEYDERYIWD